MVAALRWERGIRWDALSREERIEVAALWSLRWRDGR